MENDTSRCVSPKSGNRSCRHSSRRKKERIWINQHELIGSFKILPEEVSENDIADESIPDDLREFFELNAHHK